MCRVAFFPYSARFLGQSSAARNREVGGGKWAPANRNARRSQVPNRQIFPFPRLTCPLPTIHYLCLDHLQLADPFRARQSVML